MADEGSIIVGGPGLASGMCGRETRFLSTYPETRLSLTLVEERVAEGVPGIRGPAAPVPWGGLGAIAPLHLSATPSHCFLPLGLLKNLRDKEMF